jgi:hypothetical protein
MVLRSFEPRRGQLRKARNLVQADATGDGRVGGITDKTPKATRRTERFSRKRGVKGPTRTSRAAGPGW